MLNSQDSLSQYRELLIRDIAPGKPPQKLTVVVAMSGGIDSSSVAVLLHLLGYRVIGITLRLYDNNNTNRASQKSCCGSRDIEDAKKVASAFSFPHYTLDYRDTFDRDVIDPFVTQYLNGQTPIPCILCNQTVKFRDLYDVAKRLKADHLVTGHYARRLVFEGKPALFKAIDQTKDQSYFLYTTTLEQLDFIRFPLGHFRKDEIRSIAEALKIGVHDKPDSQDICFVSETYKKFIQSRLSKHTPEKGNIIDANGKVIGTHEGIYRFTVGQRRGLGHLCNASGLPLYVTRIDSENNCVHVSNKKASQTCTKVQLQKLNWLGNVESLDPQEIMVRLRSSPNFLPVRALNCTSEMTTVTLDPQPIPASPGQACVFYHQDRILGGGIVSPEEIS